MTYLRKTRLSPRAAPGHRSACRGLARGATLAVALGVSGCEAIEETEQPVGLTLGALSGTACGDPSAPAAGVNPFGAVSSVTISVTGLDRATGRSGTLAERSVRLADGQSIVLPGIPEGAGREVIVVGEGAGGTWYGRDTGLTVRRNEDTAAAMLMAPLGSFSCVPAPEAIVDVVFPASVDLGDGRILVTGGFEEVTADGVRKPSAQAWIFDSKTGTREVLAGGLGAGFERGAHTMVLVPEAGEVVILGGARQLTVTPSAGFPLSLDTAESRDDALVFDIATKTFRPVEGAMRVGRAFPRAQLLADGTVIVTGGGAWPYVSSDDRYAEVDFYDHEALGGLGGFLDIPKLRSFYSRVGHSLTLVGTTSEGLSELLIWGGTTLDRSLGNPGEVYRQSGRQREGVNGTFSEVCITSSTGQAPNFLYFHETTRLGDNRFLVTGGVIPGAGDTLQAPASDEAWILTYYPEVSDTVCPRGRVIQADRVAGFGPGRVFHSATSSDGRHVSVVGGWAGLSQLTGTSTVMTFDRAQLGGTPWRNEAATSAMRGGHAAVVTPSGFVFLTGGSADLQSGGVRGRISAEIWAPPGLPRP
jgi:hypothetical protein